MTFGSCFLFAVKLKDNFNWRGLNRISGIFPTKHTIINLEASPSRNFQMLAICSILVELVLLNLLFSASISSLPVHLASWKNLYSVYYLKILIHTTSLFSQVITTLGLCLFCTWKHALTYVQTTCVPSLGTWNKVNIDQDQWLHFSCKIIFSGQSYKAPTIVIYESRVIPDLKLPHITTLES